MSLRISTPTKGERLLIHRRREDLTQRDAAESYGVSLYCYRKWEDDVEDGGDDMDVGRLSDIEKCLLLRRRKGLTIPDLAKMIGCSRLWLNQMEKGTANPERLIAHWRGE